MTALFYDRNNPIHREYLDLFDKIKKQTKYTGTAVDFALHASQYRIIKQAKQMGVYTKELEAQIERTFELTYDLELKDGDVFKFDDFVISVNGKMVEYYDRLAYDSEFKDEIENNITGYWTYRTKSLFAAANICRAAAESEAVVKCMHSQNIWESKHLVAIYFFVNGDDIEAQHNVIEFMMKNGLIRSTEYGKMCNISFQHIDKSIPKLSLDQFVDLETCEWKD